MLVLVAVAGGCWAVTVVRMQGMDMGPGTDLGGLGWFARRLADDDGRDDAPLALAHGRRLRARRGRGQARSIAGTLAFAAGYLLPWAAFGVLAYALVEGARSLDLGVLAWDRAGRYVAGGVILGAALYELTRIKGTCLQHCRDSRPLRQRPGVTGALVMGVDQGGFCVGCSGALMAALFALGVMSIAWMLVIASPDRDREASALDARSRPVRRPLRWRCSAWPSCSSPARFPG